MKYIEIKDFTAPVGQEWSATSYPGEGAYLTASGQLVLVFAGVAWCGPMDFARHLKSGSPGASGNVDVNRLLDQILELRKPA